MVKIVAGCICGSDLWPYRGENKITPGSRIGHEYVGIVEEVGADVRTVKPGDFVVTPFVVSDGTCPNCLAGCSPPARTWSATAAAGPTAARASTPSVPWADGTLVATPEVPDDSLVPSLLTLSDVMGTGWHAARAARVKAGDTVVVVGDGAVGLCGVLAAARMGAERVVALSRHEPRQKIAREFGATHIIAERGDEAQDRRTGTDRRGGRGRGTGVCRDGPVDRDRLRRRAAGGDGRVRRRAARGRGADPDDVQPQRRTGRRGGTDAGVPARPDGGRTVRRDQSRTGVRLRSCRWRRWPRATRRCTSGARSRCCSSVVAGPH